ncbi:MAG: hypothetical protein AAF560_20030 [Acidobacteriota bacterium]
MSAMQANASDPVEVAWKGIELCRRDDWNEGLYWLSQAAAGDEHGHGLPALFYCYLGFGVAKYQDQVAHGLRLCKRAVDLELYQPESYYFLARTHLLDGDRRAAFKVVERGLRIDATHGDLLELKNELGERRKPLISWLPRRHPVNRLLGKARHRLLGSKHR